MLKADAVSLFQGDPYAPENDKFQQSHLGSQTPLCGREMDKDKTVNKKRSK